MPKLCLLGGVVTPPNRGLEREAGDAVSLESPVGIMREQTDLRVGLSLLDVVDDRILRGGVTEVGSGHVVEQADSPHDRVPRVRDQGEERTLSARLELKVTSSR